jgi:hypothetical protein
MTVLGGQQAKDAWPAGRYAAAANRDMIQEARRPDEFTSSPVRPSDRCRAKSIFQLFHGGPA